MRQQTIVVGVDGSAPSKAALRWAVAEADRRGMPLRIVAADGWHGPNSGLTEDVLHAHALAALDGALATAAGMRTEVAVTGTTVAGQPARALLDAAADADLLVVGSHGHTGFTAAVLGSVGLQVATHAPVPVAVVRGRADTAIGPVVVGVDGSAEAEAAVGPAFDQAAGRGCGIVVVRAYQPPVPAWGLDLPPVPYDRERVEQQLRRELTDLVAPWRAKYPDVPVETLIGRGAPAHVLVGVSRGAQLVVVGSRGHGGFAGLLLGSVSHHLVHHADCPVLVIRPVDDPARR